MEKDAPSSCQYLKKYLSIFFGGLFLTFNIYILARQNTWNKNLITLFGGYEGRNFFVFNTTMYPKYSKGLQKNHLLKTPIISKRRK